MTPRQRGLHPESSVGRFGKQVSVTINLDAELFDWLKGYVGRNSFTFCVEEAIITGLRVMKGELSIHTLKHVVASNYGISPVEALYGRMDEVRRKETSLLLDAAACAATFDKYPALMLGELSRLDPGDRLKLLVAWQAVTKRDVAAEIAALQVDVPSARSDGAWEAPDEIIPF